jgi:hypothetical protein
MIKVSFGPYRLTELLRVGVRTVYNSYNKQPPTDGRLEYSFQALGR